MDKHRKIMILIKPRILREAEAIIDWHWEFLEEIRKVNAEIAKYGRPLLTGICC